MRLGIAHHLGWAVAVTAGPGHVVVDRRRIELVEPGVGPMPVEHDIVGLGDDEAAGLVEAVRASARRATAAALTTLAHDLDDAPEPITSISLRAWPPDFPDDLRILRQPPFSAQADSVLYRQVLDEVAHALGWEVHLYDGKGVEAMAANLLGRRADDVLHGPRRTLGPPWAKDHRMALAATVIAGGLDG